MYAAYIAQLPNGLGSYPECQGKSSLLVNALDDLPQAADTLGDVDDVIEALVKHPPPVSTWLPEVHLSAALLAMAEGQGMNAAHFDAWIAHLSQQLYDRPLYRFLMKVTSPNMLLRGAQKRWSAFHRGTELRVLESTDGRAVGELRRPTHVFGIRDGSVTIALQVAVAAAGGQAVAVQLLDDTDDTLRFELTWR